MRKMTEYRPDTQVQHLWGRQTREAEADPTSKVANADEVASPRPEAVQDPFDLAFIPWTRPSAEPTEGNESQR